MLGSSVEYHLVQYIISISQRGFGLTPKDVRSRAYEYVVLNNIPNNFDTPRLHFFTSALLCSVSGRIPRVS